MNFNMTNTSSKNSTINAIICTTKVCMVKY